MPSLCRFSFRWRQATSVVLLAGLVSSAATRSFAAEAAAPTAMTALISRLSEKGMLSKEDAADLLLLAEADAADAQAQAAALKAAEARAAAAEARARALAAMAMRRSGAGAVELPVADARVAAPYVAPATPAPVAPLVSAAPVAPVSAPAAPQNYTANEQAVAEAVARYRAGKVADTEIAETAPAAPITPATHSVPARSAARTASAPTVVADAAPAGEEMAEGEEGDDVVRVTYVPEVVKQQLREEVKQEVLAEAREEGWATPRAVPDWVSRFRFFGDIRTRYEGIRFPDGNDNTGVFPNFNTINAGAPFDISGTIFSPQYNVDQDRSRFRLRARLGTALELGDGFSGGLRLATGDGNSPVSQNQTIGGAGLAQGGQFSKYSVWLDRAFLRYELGGMPDEDLMFTLGRQDNPFLSTVMLWADDLGFDGFTTQGRLGLGDSVTTFFTAGAYPVFNTDLNFATNQPSKFKSTDKWLYAAQLGASIDLGESVVLKLAAAYYPFSGVEGRLSTPFVPFSAVDAGDTDSTRPSFAQKGNTYMMLRDIPAVAGDAASGGNQNGTINQFQYFGLASEYKPLVADLRLEFNHFEPFQIALTGEYAKNLAFDSTYSAAIAVNNRGEPTTAEPQGIYLGRDSAWIALLTVGDMALQKRWDWSLSVGYREVGSDALIDGFVDSDFGGGGTNVKGMTFIGHLALSPRVWMSLRWMSATEVTGPQFKSDIFQFDVTGKF